MTPTHVDSAPGRGDFPEEIEHPSLVGTWIASFVSWNAVDAWNFIPRFADTKFKKIFGEPVDQHWQEEWDNFVADPENAEEIILNSIKHPAPVGTLLGFQLREDRTFDLIFQRNLMERFEYGQSNGIYTIEWISVIGAFGGAIMLLDEDKSIHLTMKFLLVSKDEMRFITAYGASPEPEVIEVTQSGAGTLRRARYE